jgi:hypothetical protein
MHECNQYTRVVRLPLGVGTSGWPHPSNKQTKRINLAYDAAAQDQGPIQTCDSANRVAPSSALSVGQSLHTQRHETRHVQPAHMR